MRTCDDGRSLLSRWQRLLLVPLLLVGAPAAFVHAASENGIYKFALPETLPSSLNATVRSRLVDAQYRAAFALAAQDQSAQPTIGEKLGAQALAVYRVDPLNIEILRTVALTRYSAATPTDALRLLTLATALNQRDSIANLWLIQEYARQQDLSDMLAAFDRLLRTSKRIRQSAMPQFIAALAVPEGREEVIGLLSTSPDWTDDFWIEFARNPVALDHVLEFFGRQAYEFETLPEAVRMSIYTNLKKTDRFEALAQLVSRDASLRDSEEAKGFIVEDAQNPFGWALSSKGNLTAGVQQRNSSLMIDGEPGAFGRVATKLERNIGPAVLAVSSDAQKRRNMSLEVTATCAGAQEVVARIVLGPGQSEGEAPIPAVECAFLELAISARAISQSGRAEAQIASVSIGRLP